jgi:hypothetical protein
VTRTISQQRGLAELRRNTEWFIADDPSSIVLTPHTKTREASGGYTWVAGSPRTAQTFKLIPFSLTPDGIVRSEGGEVRNWTYFVVGTYDAEIEIGDTWSDGNTMYRVTGIVHANDYEIKAAATAFGVDPNYG